MFTYLLSVSFLICSVLLIRGIFRKSVSPRVIYALWLVVIVRIAIPISFFKIDYTLPYYPSESDIEQIEQNEQLKDKDKFTADVHIQSPTTSDIQTPIQHPDTISPDNFTETTQKRPENEINDTNIEEYPEMIDWKRIAGLIWFGGSSINAMWMLHTSIRYTRQLIKSRKLYKTIGKTKVYVSEFAGVPCVAGIIPSIYITPETVNSESEAVIIQHEHIHLRHGDHLWSMVRALSLIVFWWNPLIWIAAKISKQDAELACDDAVASKLNYADRLKYANVLLDTIPQRHRYAIGLGSSPMKERIIMLTKKQDKKWICLIFTVLLVLMSTGCAFLSINDDSDNFTVAYARYGITVVVSDLYVGDKENSSPVYITPQNELDDNVIAEFTQAALKDTNGGWLFSIVRHSENELLSEKTNHGNFVYFAKDNTHWYGIMSPTDVQWDLESKELTEEYNKLYAEKDKIIKAILKENRHLIAKDNEDAYKRYSEIKLSSQGPFVGYVANKETPWIDLYTDINGTWVGKIPYEIFHDWIATDRNSEGWTPGWDKEYICYYYAEFDNFRWAAVHLENTVLGVGRKNIATSIDGGKTWTFGSTSDNYGGNHVVGIGFASENIAFMSFDPYNEHDGADGPVISRTTDGGKTWKLMDVRTPESLIGRKLISGTPFYDEDLLRFPIWQKPAHGIKDGEAMYLISRDSGLTWEWDIESVNKVTEKLADTKEIYDLKDFSWENVEFNVSIPLKSEDIIQKYNEMTYENYSLAIVDTKDSITYAVVEIENEYLAFCEIYNTYVSTAEWETFENVMQRDGVILSYVTGANSANICYFTFENDTPELMLVCNTKSDTFDDMVFEIYGSMGSKINLYKREGSELYKLDINNVVKSIFPNASQIYLYYHSGNKPIIQIEIPENEFDYYIQIEKDKLCLTN